MTGRARPVPRRLLPSRAPLPASLLVVLVTAVLAALVLPGCSTGPAPSSPPPARLHYPDLRGVRTWGGVLDQLDSWQGSWSLLATTRAGGPRSRSTVSYQESPASRRPAGPGSSLGHRGVTLSFQGPVLADGAPAPSPAAVWVPADGRCFWRDLSGTASDGASPERWLAASSTRQAAPLSFRDAFLSWAVPLPVAGTGVPAGPWYLGLPRGTPVARDDGDLFVSVPGTAPGTSWELRVHLGVRGRPDASSARLVGAASSGPAPEEARDDGRQDDGRQGDGRQATSRRVSVRTWSAPLAARSATPATSAAGTGPCGSYFTAPR